MEDNLPPQIAMSQMIFGYVTTKAIHVAAKLNIADLLAEHGPMDSSELAQRTGADGERTPPLQMVGSYNANDRWQGTQQGAISRYFLKGRTQIEPDNPCDSRN